MYYLVYGLLNKINLFAFFLESYLSYAYAKVLQATHRTTTVKPVILAGSSSVDA